MGLARSSGTRFLSHGSAMKNVNTGLHLSQDSRGKGSSSKLTHVAVGRSQLSSGLLETSVPCLPHGPFPRQWEGSEREREHKRVSKMEVLLFS